MAQFPMVFRALLFLLVSFGLLVSPADAAQKKKSAKKSTARKGRAAKNVARPRTSFVPRQQTLGGTGLQPRTNLALSDPVMKRLHSAARNFLESPTPLYKQELQRFAEQNRNHQAAALAWLALGYGSLDAKNEADAAYFLRTGRQAQSPVSDYLDYYYAVALQRLKQHRDSIAALEGFEQRFPASSLVGRAVIARAYSQVESGYANAAAELLKARLGALPRPDADMLLGRAYDVSGNPAAAVQAYRQVYYTYPTTNDADDAAKEIARLTRSPEAARAGVPVSLRRERAERLFNARRWRAAEEAWRDVAGAASGAERERALVHSAGSAFRAGSTSAALRSLAAFSPSDPEADAERLYYLAESYRRSNRDGDFITTVRRLGEKYPQSVWYHEALLSAGNFFLLARNFTEANNYYRTLYQQFPNGEDAPLAHWRVAWRAYRNSDLEQARRLFEEHVVRYPQASTVAGALYWLGRLAETSDRNVAQAYFRAAGERYPQYFYGTLSAQKLGDARVVPAAAAVLPENVVRVLNAVPVYRPQLLAAAPPADLAQHRQKVQLLEAAALIDLAIIELRHSTDDVTHSQFLLLELARLQRDRGNFISAIEHIRRVFPNYFALPLEQLDRGYWELLFPMPWMDVIKTHSARLGLDPFLVTALMRQESAFNRYAVSHANAYGLMQLLPSTARNLARKMGLPRPGVTDLFDPDTNIQLGTQYLYDVLRQFDGRIEAALASYNAGPHRVDNWLSQDTYRDLPEFVESIPFTETREYVQAVMRNATIYRRLYAK